MKIAINIVAVVAATLLSGTSFSREVIRNYSCTTNTNPEYIIKSFIASSTLEPEPYNNQDAILSFAATIGNTAFGFPFVAIIAWQDQKPFFGRMPGTRPPTSIDIIIQAQPWEVRRALSKAGISVPWKTVGTEYPKIYIEAFNSERQENLPPNSDKSIAYTRLSCTIHT